MLEFTYDEEKEKLLNEIRNVSFKDVISQIEVGEFIIIPNPNQKKHKGGAAFVVKLDGYYCVSPFIKVDNKIVLKTIFKDRKINKGMQNEIN